MSFFLQQNVTMEESTIEVVLERLVMKIDAAAVAAYHANNSGRRQRAAAEKEKKAAATARLVLQLCSLLAQHGGYRALSAVDCSTLDADGLKAVGLSGLAAVRF